MIKVPKRKFTYSTTPIDRLSYTNKMDSIYTRFAKAYDGFMIVFPLWKKWLRTVLPFVKGTTILEVSFGPGYLLSQYPKDYTLYGLDYNKTMVERAKHKMNKIGKTVQFTEGNVENMPYPDEFFDTVINTMAFSGYPDGNLAIKEMLRVLKKDGILIILDYDYPKNQNIMGYLIVKLIEKSGDIIKDIGSILQDHNAPYRRKAIGCFGSIHLFIIRKPKSSKGKVN